MPNYMRKIKLFKPYVSWYAVWNAVKTLRSGQLAEGPRVKEFEREFGKKFNMEHICSLNSGTTALELAYELAGIKEGDEVITPVLTCTATNIPLVRLKAKIIFADIENDLNISIEDVKKKITPRTKAIVFVHFGGNNRGLKELVELAKKRNILLIEDAAQAIGSDYWGKADFTCVSLQAIKILTSGDGGILICKNPELDKKARRLRWFGYDRDLKQKQGDSDLIEAGYKYHMNDVTAAIALGNLKVIDKLVDHRKKLIEEYKKHGIDAHIWFATVFNKRRDGLKKYLSDNGIESGVYHYRNDKYTIFGGKQSFKNMDRLENDYLVLPLHQYVTVSDVQYICGVINKFNTSQSS